MGVQLGINSSRAVYDGNTMTTRIVEDIVINSVEAGYPAEGKLQEKDIVKSITVGGRTKEVTRSFHVIDALLNAREGDTVTLTVVRVVDEEVKQIQVEITLTAESFSPIN